jgi:hypothetical protein
MTLTFSKCLTLSKMKGLKLFQFNPRAGNLKLYTAVKIMLHALAASHFHRRHDTQHNDTQHNDIQYNNKQNATLSITTLGIMAEHNYAYCCFCRVSHVSLLCRVSYAECRILNVVMLNAIMPSVVIMNVVLPFYPSLIF